jgi:hypothetical protein
MFSRVDRLQCPGRGTDDHHWGNSRAKSKEAGLAAIKVRG